MRAFRSGKRDFVKDEIVFVVDKLDNFMDILIGKINTYAGYGKCYVDLYTVTEKKEDIEPAFRAALENKHRPTIIEFMIDPEDLVYPMIKPGGTLEELIMDC